jgi:nucleoside-diphosphate-sugar epimerase
MKTVLVAGGAGFIGSHLCERLIREEKQVICIDNLVTGNLRNIEPLLDAPGFRLVEHDVVKPLPSLPEVEAIFHLASPASPIAYQRYPIETIVAGSDGTHQLLKLAARNEARFLFASTSEVYGDPLEHPQHEDYWGNVNPNGPRSMYDEAKRFGEALTMTYRRARGVDTRIVRIFNTYGPRMEQDDGRVISNFITQALRNEPLTVYGDGSQTRSFQYIDDLVDGLVRAMATAWDGAINLGNPDEYTVIELAQLVRDATGLQSRIDFRPLPTDDPKQRCPDISRAKRLLDWEPKVPILDGLARTVAYFRDIMSHVASAPGWSRVSRSHV